MRGSLIYAIADAVVGLVLRIIGRPKKPKKKPVTVGDLLEAKARAEAKTRVITRQ